MSIFEKIFGSQNPQAPAAAQNVAPNPGQIPTNPAVSSAVSPGAAPNGVVPNNVPAPESENKDPLDAFKDIWQPNENQPEPQPLISVDAKTLAEASKKTDFTKLITPEQLQGIAAGGEEGVKAFAQAMNAVAQGVYAQSAFASTKIVEQAVSKAKEQWAAELPSHVKIQNISETLRTENPALSHPAAAPLLGAIQATLTQKHPNASASEITAMAKQYLGDFANAVQSPEKKLALEKQQKEQSAGETDWSTYA